MPKPTCLESISKHICLNGMFPEQTVEIWPRHEDQWQAMINRTGCFWCLLSCLVHRHLLNWQSWPGIIFKWIDRPSLPIAPCSCLCTWGFPLEGAVVHKCSTIAISKIMATELIRLWLLNEKTSNLFSIHYEEYWHVFVNLIHRSRLRSPTQTLMKRMIKGKSCISDGI